MQRITSNSILKLEFSILKRLNNYIDKNTKTLDITRDIKMQYPILQDIENFTGFNLWIYADFFNKDGKSTVENFVEKEGHNLNLLELEYLKTLSDSYLSLYEIKQVNNRYLILKNLLEDEEIKLITSKANPDLNEDDYIFARVGKFKDYHILIGDLNIMPSTVKHLFLKEFLAKYNRKMEKDRNLSIKEYIKSHSLELIENFFSCIYSAIEIDENISTYFFEELDEFESYLRNKNTNVNIERHIINLIEFFDYYLFNEDMTLYDMNQIDLYDFIDAAMFEGFINSQEDLNSYIRTLKLYLSFLSNKNTIYNKVFMDIKDISEKRFLIMEKLESNTRLFQIDSGLQERIEPMLNEQSQGFLNDMDKFILYILENSLILTYAKNNIKRMDLLELNDIMENRIVPKTKAPNQQDFPVIELFYDICINLDLLYMDKNKLIANQKSSNYIRLSDGQKYSMILSYLLGTEFKSLDEEFITSARANNLESYLNKNKDNVNEYFNICETLTYLGLFIKDQNRENNYIVSKLGRCFLEIAYSKKKISQSNQIIDIKDFRKNK